MVVKFGLYGGYQIRLTDSISEFEFCPTVVPMVGDCMDEESYHNSSANNDDGLVSLLIWMVDSSALSIVS